MGFERVIEVLHHEPYFLSDHFQVEILAADNLIPPNAAAGLDAIFKGLPLKARRLTLWQYLVEMGKSLSILTTVLLSWPRGL